MEGFRWMVYAPGILPVVSKDLGNAFLREMMSHTSCIVRWSCKEGIFCVKWS